MLLCYKRQDSFVCFLFLLEAATLLCSKFYYLSAFIFVFFCFALFFVFVLFCFVFFFLFSFPSFFSFFNLSVNSLLEVFLEVSDPLFIKDVFEEFVLNSLMPLF